MNLQIAEDLLNRGGKPAGPEKNFLDDDQESKTPDVA